jgi:hypothetical protein
MYEKVCEDDGHLKLNKGAFEFTQVEVQQLLKMAKRAVAKDEEA